MQELSARDLRQNFQNAMRMLVIANCTPRDASGKKIPGMVLSEEQIKQKMGEINEDEVTQGYIWTEASLLVNRQWIQFPVVDTVQVANSPVTSTMKLITMQDSFMMTSLSYFLMQYRFADGNQENPDFSDSNISWTPITYVSTWSNNDTEINMDNGCAMFWVGAFINLEVNKKMVIPYWDCYRHYKAPIVQATPSFPAPSNYMPNTKNQHDGSVDGFYPVEPNIILGGGRGNVLKLNLAANIPATIAPFNQNAYGTTFIYKAVICTRGILMQNSTNVK